MTFFNTFRGKKVTRESLSSFITATKEWRPALAIPQWLSLVLLMKDGTSLPPPSTPQAPVLSWGQSLPWPAEL